MMTTSLRLAIAALLLMPHLAAHAGGNLTYQLQDKNDDVRLTSFCDGGCTDGGCTDSGGTGCTDAGCSSRCAGGCDSGCASGCGSCCGDLGLFGGLIKPTTHCFSDFIAPMTNPVYFEDPRIETTARLIYLKQRVPATAAGGNVHLFGMQVQAKLSERLALVADKDGYIVSDNPLIDDGWADVAVGLKYNLFADACTQRILSAGFAYELPVGSTRSLQGNGDGLFHLYATGGARLGCDWHWISTSGFLLPADTAAESSIWYWSNHLDRQLTDRFYVFGETNWYHWMGAGQQTALTGVEGGDLFNFGSQGVAGNDIVTGAFGLKFKPGVNTELGVAWEAPLTDRRDVLDNRLTVDAIFKY